MSAFCCSGRNFLSCSLLAVALACLSAQILATDTGPVRVGVLKFGTVNWELDVITTHGLDTQEGVAVEVIQLGSKQATSVALLGGAADIIVADWIWVSRLRATGRSYTFVPYSLATGGVMVNPAAGIDSLAGLAHHRLGVAGGPVDKSWLLLRLYAKRILGFDLAAEVEANFAAPPLLNRLILRSEIPAVLTFWHYAARLEAAGMNELISISAVLKALDVETPIPIIGWVFDERWAARHPDKLIGFLRASYAAKRLLDDSDDEWRRIQPLLKTSSETMAVALRDAYRAGIPRVFGERERAAAGRVFELLASEGGEELVGSAPRLSPGTFWHGFAVSEWSD